MRLSLAIARLPDAGLGAAVGRFVRYRRLSSGPALVVSAGEDFDLAGVDEFLDRGVLLGTIGDLSGLLGTEVKRLAAR